MHTLRQWQTLYKNPQTLIVQASTPDGLDGWTEFPIGLGYAFQHAQLGDHSKLVLCAISEYTDSSRRPSGINRKSILANLATNGIHNSPLPSPEYFQTLPSYKFVISPEGNGIDCHRHYEAFIAGCIPIVERNSLTEKKYANLPILWTTDYSEITLEYLEQKYVEMIDKQYNFSALFLYSYPSHIRQQIKSNSNFWMNRFTGKTFYGNKHLPYLRI